MLKVSLIQCAPMTVSEMEEKVSAVLQQQEKDECQKSVWLIFPEHSLVKHVFRNNLIGLEKLADLSRICGLCFCCMELSGKDEFVTSVFLQGGCLVGSYRKRCATRTGAHKEGEEEFFFDFFTENRLKGSVLICFDVENARVRDPVFEKRPHVVFNPTQIPCLTSMTPNVSSLSVAPMWKSALESMRNKFERTCALSRVHLLRCDLSAPFAAGSTQMIGPSSSVSVASSAPHRLDVFLPDSDNFSVFGDFVRPPPRERTKQEDNAGARHVSTFVDTQFPVAAAAHFNANLLLSSKGGQLAWHSTRDGSLAALPVTEGPVTDMTAFGAKSALICVNNQNASLLEVGVWKSLSSFSVEVSDGRVSRVGRVSSTEATLLLSSGVVMLWDVRTNKSITSFGSRAGCVFGDETTLVVGEADSVVEYDRRMLNAPLMVHKTRAPVISVGKNKYLTSDGVLRGDWREDGAKVPKALCEDVVSVCNDADFAALRNGVIACGPRNYSLMLHATPVSALSLTGDRKGLLSVSRAGAVALTWFEFNCEKPFTVDEMFL